MAVLLKIYKLSSFHYVSSPYDFLKYHKLFTSAKKLQKKLAQRIYCLHTFSPLQALQFYSPQYQQLSHSFFDQMKLQIENIGQLEIKDQQNLFIL